MSTRKVYEKKDKDGNIVEPDGPTRKRPKIFDGEDHTTTEDDSFDYNSDESEVYYDNSCVAQCLQPEQHAPNLAYNADGTVNDKLTQHAFQNGRPAEEEPQQEDRPDPEEPQENRPVDEEPAPPVDFDIVDFPTEELDAILDAAANPPTTRFKHTESLL